MLLLQLQNSLSRPRSVILLSCVVHLVACFALLFVYKDYHQRLFVDLSSRISSEAVVKLLPLSASRPALVKGEGKKGGGAGKVVQKQQKKKAKAPTSLAKQSASLKREKVAKQGAKKKGKNTLKEKKEMSVQKKKGEEKVVSEPKVAEKSEIKEPVIPKKEEVLVPEPVQQNVPQVAELSPAQEGGKTLGHNGQEIVYLTQHELDALQVCQKLQESIFSVWEAPVGMAADKYCEVMVGIGWDGVVRETQFLKKTGSLVYDLSVQETIEQITFPHEVWGKQITIAFKP